MLTSATAELELGTIPENAETLVFVCAGVRVRVEGPASFIDLLPGNFVPGSQAERSESGDVNLTVVVNDSIDIFEDGELVGRFDNLQVAVEVLQLTAHQAIAARATELVFVHAGVVGFKGQGIVIPGRSHAGKTSLVLALCEAGATYYSDNYALVDSNALIHPFARVPRVRQQLAPVPVIPNQLPPLQPTRVVLTHFEAGASWSPRKVTEGESLFGLIENSVGIRLYPELYMDRLTKVATRASTYASPRGEARLVAQALINELHSNTEVNIPLGETN